MIRITGAVAALTVLLFTGCASVTEGTTHPLRIDTVTENGDAVADADCSLSNDKATMLVKSGTTTQVRRSATDLEIVCRKDGLPDATGRLISRANAGMAGNIILGGAIGAVIDHSSGAAYTYPHWVQLVFGQFGIFDRSREHEGMALTSPWPNALGTARTTAPSAVPVAAGKAGNPGSAKAASPDAATVAGDSFDYVLTDHTSGRSQTVVLRADRVEGNQVSFNGGARVESLRGDMLRMQSPLLGEMDMVTPPGGWMPGGRVPSGSWKVSHTSMASGLKMAYDLNAYVEGEERLRVQGRDIKVVRIALRGWVESLGGMTNARGSYEGTAWLAPDLHRLVRFEATAKSGGNYGGAAFTIDESAELVAFHHD